MRDTIEIEVRIDPDCREPSVLIRTDRKTQEVDNIVYAIENCVESRNPPVAGWREGAVEMLSQREIVRVYVESRKVWLCTEKGTYGFQRSLSFLEQVLNPDRFIRISRFEIVNIRKIAKFDFSMAGTVHILFEDGTVTWAARRYVRALQQAIGRAESGKEE